MPNRLVEAIQLAAITLSNEKFDAALVPVHDIDPALAEELTTLAREFRFDRILAFIDR
jgi:hypothetical protein